MNNKARLYLGDNIPKQVEVTNGNFQGSLNGWTVTTGWSYDSGSADAQWGSTQSIYQDINGVTVGLAYTVKFFVDFGGSGWAPRGTLTMTFAGVTKTYTTSGWKTEVITAVTGEELRFTQSFYFTGKIKDVSVNTLTSNVGWRELILADDTFVNLNFAIADIEDIRTRNTTFSKTIIAPSTTYNDGILEQLYDLDVTNNKYYLNQKIPAVLYYDDVELLNGICEITKVDAVHANNQAYYEIVLRGKTKNFADIVSSKYITGNEDSSEDIDFSEYNHVFSIENITKTWENTSFPNLPTSTYGSGYYYPIINYTNAENGNDFNIERLRPAIYIKELFDKIVSDAGYTYESTFLNSDYFKSLITPYTGRITTSEEELEKRKFRAGLSSDFINQYGSNLNNRYLVHTPSNKSAVSSFTIPIADDSENPPLNFFDNNNNYDIQTIGPITITRYIVPNKGVYNFSFVAIGKPYIFDTFAVAAGQYFAKSTDRNNPLPRMEVTAKIMRRRNGVATMMGKETVEIPLNRFETSKVGSTVSYTNMFQHLKSFIPGVGYKKTGLQDVNFNLNVNGIEYEKNDEVYVQIELNNKLVQWYNLLGKTITKDAFPGCVDFTRLSTDATGNAALVFFNEPIPSDNAFLGEIISMNDCLPERVRQIDFVNSLVTMFNLIIEEDRLKTNHLIIEPRVNYLALGGVKDWTNKLDRSQAIEIERIPTLIDRNVHFKYTEDNDKFNSDYQEIYVDTYGDWRVKNEDLTSEDYEISLIFSPTPGDEVDNSEIIIPQIYNIGDDNKLIIQPYNMRILHRVDIIDAPGSSFRTATNKSNVSLSVNAYSAGKITQTVWIANSIPTASHLDDPYNPVHDLNWGYSKKYFNTLYPDSLPSWGNLYNEYWRDYIELLIDKNSKMITAQFNLTEQDIYNFRFYDKIKIDGQFYIVNKIIDWNPDRLTTVQLIQDKISTLPVTQEQKTADTERVIDYNNITYKNSVVTKSNRNDGTVVQQQTGTNSFTTTAPVKRSFGTYASETYPVPLGENWDIYSGVTTGVTFTVTGETLEASPTIISEDSRGYSTGVNNNITSINFFLAGNDNNFSGNTYNTLTVGDNNTYNDNVTNISILGSGNYVEGGITGSTILGNNTSVTKSDTLVIGHKTILTKTIIEPIVDVIAAPNLDGKQINPFNRMKQIQVVSGGNINQGVRSLKSANTTFVVNSRETPTTSYISYAEVELDVNGNPIV